MTLLNDDAQDRLIRAVVVAGFTLGWVLGLAGAAVGAGTTQNILYAVSSIGLTTGAVILGVSLIGRNLVMASGLVILALGEAVIHTQGPGGADAFAAATYAYFPGLLLAALSGWGPGWTRLTAAVSGIAFGIHAFAHAGGADVTLDGPIASVGYVLLSSTLIGWTWHLLKTSTRRIEDLAEPQPTASAGR